MEERLAVDLLASGVVVDEARAALVVHMDPIDLMSRGRPAARPEAVTQQQPQQQPNQKHGTRLQTSHTSCHAKCYWQWQQWSDE